MQQRVRLNVVDTSELKQCVFSLLIYYYYLISKLASKATLLYDFYCHCLLLPFLPSPYICSLALSDILCTLASPHAIALGVDGGLKIPSYSL